MQSSTRSDNAINKFFTDAFLNVYGDSAKLLKTVIGCDLLDDDYKQALERIVALYRAHMMQVVEVPFPTKTTSTQTMTVKTLLKLFEHLSRLGRHETEFFLDSEGVTNARPKAGHRTMVDEILYKTIKPRCQKILDLKETVSQIEFLLKNL